MDHSPQNLGDIRDKEEAVRNSGGGKQSLQNSNEAAPTVTTKEGSDARDRIVTTTAHHQWLKKNPDSHISLSFRDPALSEEKDRIAICFRENRKWPESQPPVSVQQEFTSVTRIEETVFIVSEEYFYAFSWKCKEKNHKNFDNSLILTERSSGFISQESEKKKKKKALCSELHLRITDNPSSFLSWKNNKKNAEDTIHLKKGVQLFSGRKQVISSSLRAFFETVGTSLDQNKDSGETEQQSPSDMDVTLQNEKCGVEINERTVTDVDLQEKKKHHLRQIVWLPRNWFPLPRLGRDTIVGPQITMKYEMLRLCTMKSFPGQDRPLAIRIIGFYYAGHQDQVVCYCCGNRKDNWVLGDIPLLIHQKIAPDCGLLTHNALVSIPIRIANSTKSQSPADVYLLTIQRSDGLNQPDTAHGESSLMLPSSEQNQVNISNMPHQMLVTNKSSPPNQLMTSGRQNVLDNLQTVSAHTDSMEKPPHKYPQYAVKNMRINSFQGWPTELQQRPEKMAECGFYYAGFSDYVRCYFCGVGLRHWMSEDDPWIEHARWSTSCTYVRKMKGEEFISLVKMAVEIAEREKAARNNGGENQAPKCSSEAVPTITTKEESDARGRIVTTTARQQWLKKNPDFDINLSFRDPVLSEEKEKIATCFQEHRKLTKSHPSVSGVQQKFTSVRSTEKYVLMVREDPFDTSCQKYKNINVANICNSSIITERPFDFISLDKKKDSSETEQQILSDMDVTVQKRKCVVEFDERTTSDIDLKEKKKHHLKQIVCHPRNVLPLPRFSRDTIIGFGHEGSTLPPAGHEELREMLRQLASGNIPGPQITMKYEMLRLCTMKSFPGRDRPFAIRIIGAGFYYAGHQDQVICYCCGNRKDNWVLGDIPLLIHQKMAPDCDFLTHNALVNVPIRTANSTDSQSPAEVHLLAIQQSDGSNQSDMVHGESSLMLPSSEQNLVDISNMPHQMLVTNKSSPPNQLMASGRQNVLNNLQTVSAHIDSVEEPPPKYPQYAVKNMRINSFQGWPTELREKPEEMAECGFYYTGFSDCVRCFFCGVGLRHWMSEDDPWIEHARWSTSCTYVRKMKGEEFISLVKMAVKIAEREKEVRNNGGENQAPKCSSEAVPTITTKEGTEELLGNIIMEAPFEIEQEDTGQPKPQASNQSAEGHESIGKAFGPPKCSSTIHHSKSSNAVLEGTQDKSNSVSSLISPMSYVSLQGMEYILKEHFDACIIYCEADENDVYEFKDHLEKLDLGPSEHPKICLYTEEKVWGPTKFTEKAKFVCKHCTLIFVYLSKRCSPDEHVDFFQNEVILATVKNCRVRPVLSEKDCAIPFGLKNAPKIEWYNRNARSYKENILSLFQMNISGRLRREAEGIESILSTL